MAITGYKMQTKTGGGVNAADGIDGSTLADGDFVFVMTTPTDDALLAYVVDDDYAPTEKDPDAIVPDTNPGNIGLRLMRNVPVPIAITVTATGSVVVDNFPDTLGAMARWDYVVSKATSLRAGTVIAVWDASGTSVQYSESVTPEIGDTSDISFVFTNASSTVELKVVANTTGWVIDTLRIRI